MVIRSVAGCGPASPVAEPIGEPFDSNSARIAIRASADSEMPRLAARSAKRCFSSGVGRAVIEKARGVGWLLFTRSPLLVQQNADTSLSCHQNNTNSKTGDSNSGRVPDIGEFERDK